MQRSSKIIFTNSIVYIIVHIILEKWCWGKRALDVYLFLNW